jgi:hypothetical protein
MPFRNRLVAGGAASAFSVFDATGWAAPGLRASCGARPWTILQRIRIGKR